jgi:hypothetical protein
MAALWRVAVGLGKPRVAAPGNHAACSGVCFETTQAAERSAFCAVFLGFRAKNTFLKFVASG